MLALIKKVICKCDSCEHEWKQEGEIPLRCAKCKSPYWNRKYRPTKRVPKRMLNLIEKYGTPIGYRGNIPILTAILDPKRNNLSMLMVCQYCKTEHVHGAENEIGHRTAHCPHSDDSPYTKTGYYLVRIDGEGE